VRGGVERFIRNGMKSQRIVGVVIDLEQYLERKCARQQYGKGPAAVPQDGPQSGGKGFFYEMVFYFDNPRISNNQRIRIQP
jgi:hypothetical protein